MPPLQLSRCSTSGQNATAKTLSYCHILETAFHRIRKHRISPGLSIVRRSTHGGIAAKIVISERQQKLLEEFRKSRTIGKSIAQRAAIVLLGFAGMLNEEIALRVDLNRQQVGLWRQRWREAWEALCVWECTAPPRLREAIADLLSDAPRPGAPATFAAEQVSQIVALACEPPTRWIGRNWTPAMDSRLGKEPDEVLGRIFHRSGSKWNGAVAEGLVGSRGAASRGR